MVTQTQAPNSPKKSSTGWRCGRRLWCRRAGGRARVVSLAVGLFLVLFGSVVSSAAGAGPISPVGSWSAVAHCDRGWCAGQDFPRTQVFDSWDPATGAVKGPDITGTFDGSVLKTTASSSGYKSYVTATMSADGNTLSGTWTDSHNVGGTDKSTRVGVAPTSVPATAPATPSPVPSKRLGSRPSATWVICNRDMTKPATAVFGCNVFVFDASGEAVSRTPTGVVSWTATAGGFSGGSSASCTLLVVNVGAAGCSVAFSASNDAVPIETAPPVSASYAGDATFEPSTGSDRLGPESDLSQFQVVGLDSGQVTSGKPTCGCGDPVNPDDGSLSVANADVLIPGLGAPLGVVRTYSSAAAAAAVTGTGIGVASRFGAGWTDNYDARLMIAGGSVTVRLASGATVPFTSTAAGFVAPGWVTARLSSGGGGTYVLTLADQRVLTFDGAGRLAKVSDRTGETTTLAYDTVGALTAVTDPSGRSLAFTSDTAGHVTGVSDPAGRHIGYGYDAAGNLVQVTDVGGGVTRYAYNGQHRLVSVTDPNGSTSTTSYDASGRVSEQVDPLGHHLGFAYAGTFPNLITTITDGNANRSIYAYRGGVLISATLAAGTAQQSQTNYVYDTHLSVVAVIDPDGRVWRSTVDAAGNVTASTDPLGRTTTVTYDAFNNPVTLTDPAGVATTTSYDSHGLAVKTVRAVGTPAEATIVTERDRAHPGEITAVVDPSGAKTSYRYDASGDLIGETDPTGAISTATYDSLGQTVFTVGPLGNQAGASPTTDRTAFTYDPYGDILTVTDPGGHTSSTTYDANHNPVSAVDPAGRTASTRYDAAGRPVAATFADGTTRTVTLDNVGNVVAQTDPSGNATTYTFDALNRPTSRTDPLGHTFKLEHDPAGNVTVSTDATGRSTRYTYDAANQLTAIGYDDPATAAVSFTYDIDGRRATMTDGTGTTTYHYDQQSRITAVTDGAGRTVTSTFNSRGDLTRLGYPSGLQIEHTYDPSGRLTAVTDGAGHTNTFIYDPDGNLATALLGDGTHVAYARDAGHALLAITDTATGAADPYLSFTVTRDQLEQIVTQTGTNASTVTATYDTALHLTALGDQHYATDAAGNLTTLRGATLTYNTSGQLTSTTANTAYTYDPNGQRTSTNGSTTANYQYDQAGRLTAVGGTPGTPIPAPPTSWWPIILAALALALALLAGAATAFTIRRRRRRGRPAATNLLAVLILLVASITTNTATATVVAAQPATTAYAYNGDGLRTATTSPTGSTTQFTWTQVDTQPLLIADGTNQYVQGPGGTPLEQIDAAGKATWLHDDPNGTVTTLTDTTGAITATYAYDPYGQPTGHTGTATTPIGYQGQYTDPDTGLHYLTARYYDPATAQFLTPDPLTDTTHQPYAYTDNNPLNRTDPTGLQTAGWFTDYSRLPRAALAGHGAFLLSTFTVPEGTWITFHAPPGSPITDQFGKSIEGGAVTKYNETYGPGDIVPEHRLSAPDGLDVLGTSTTVASDTLLSQLLKPNMGRVDWAACRTSIDYNSGDERQAWRDAITAAGLPHGTWDASGQIYDEFARYKAMSYPQQPFTPSWPQLGTHP